MMNFYAAQAAVGLTMYAWSPGPYTSAGESNVVPLRRRDVS